MLYFLLFERYERQGRRYDYLDARATLAEAAFVYTARGTLAQPQRVLFPLAALEPTVAADVQTLLGLGGEVQFVHPRALDTATPRAAYRLLADCGVRHPSPRDVVERWLLPLYEGERWHAIPPSTRDAIVRLLFVWWAGDELDLAGRLSERLGALRLRTADDAWERADRLYLGAAYLPGDELAEVLCGVPYVSADYLGAAADVARWRAFLAALGVAARPRVRPLVAEVPGPPPVAEAWWDAYVREGLGAPGAGRVHTAVVEGLAATLASGDPQRLACLARLLAEHWAADYAPLAEACWLDAHTAAGPGAFVYLLRREAWLPTTLGLRPPRAAYAPPTARPAALLADLLPLAAVARVADWTSGPWPTLGLRSADEPAALVAALAAVPARLEGAAALERAFALYRELSAQTAAGRPDPTLTVGDTPDPAGGGDAPFGLPQTGDEPSVRDALSRGLRLPGEDGRFHPSFELYVRDDEQAYLRFRDRVAFAATPPGEAPRRYVALLRALGVPSAAAAWRAEVLLDEPGASTPQRRGSAAGDERPAGRAQGAALRRTLAARQRYLASLAAHVGAPPPRGEAILFVAVPRLVVRETLGAAEVVANRRAFCAAPGAPLYLRAGGAPAWLETAEALAVHLGWPRELIVLLRLALTASADELELLFRLHGIALVA
ncbi:MAG: hypothetical protein HYU88_12085 [Chloroflexi bacterium]|nr:hypothetical protein [Chloroflexota bacterium]